MTDTVDKLLAAFAGESQANRRYLAFAKKAEEEGLPQVAKLFRAAAEAETVHALNHLRIAGKVGIGGPCMPGVFPGVWVFRNSMIYWKML